MRNSCLQLNHPFRKTSIGQNGLFYIGPAICNRIPEILSKTKNLNTFKHKMKYYYLNDLSKSNLWNIGGFNYVLAFLKIIFLFIKYFYFLFLASFWLKDRNENKAIRLLCVIFAILFFFSPIVLLISTFFVCYYFFTVW